MSDTDLTAENDHLQNRDDGGDDEVRAWSFHICAGQLDVDTPSWGGDS